MKERIKIKIIEELGFQSKGIPYSLFLYSPFLYSPIRNSTTQHYVSMIILCPINFRRKWNLKIHFFSNHRRRNVSIVFLNIIIAISATTMLLNSWEYVGWFQIYKNGKPFSHQENDIWPFAFNNAFFLESAVYFILRKNFSHKSSHVELVNTWRHSRGLSYIRKS